MRFHPTPGDGGGLAESELDDVVRDGDADIDDIIVGREPEGSCKHSMAPLPLQKMMSPAEYARHGVTYMPYHPGCPLCAMGRRPNTHHRRRRNSNARTLPHVVADYGFLRANDDDLTTMLVVYSRPWRMYFSTICSVKGQ